MSKELIKIEHLCKYFGNEKKPLKAIDDITLSIYENETLGLVGESGCGKSTIGKVLVNVFKKTSGKIFYDGEEVTDKNEKKYQKHVNMIFQDSISALDPRMTVKELIEEPQIIGKFFKDKETLNEHTYRLMSQVGIRKDYESRYVYEFSGGQCQRINIARTLASHPDFIVCDEPVSALDVSIRAQIINLFIMMKEKYHLTYLFITHDLLTARYIADRIAVMYLGCLVELASAKDIYSSPLHPYTKALISAISIPDIDKMKEIKRIELEGEIPSPIDKPSGCPFRTRCKYATEKCSISAPKFEEVSPSHFVACHRINEI